MATVMEKKVLRVWMSHAPFMSFQVYRDDGYNGTDSDIVYELLEEGYYEEATVLLIVHGWTGENAY